MVNKCSGIGGKERFFQTHIAFFLFLNKRNRKKQKNKFFSSSLHRIHIKSICIYCLVLKKIEKLDFFAKQFDRPLKQQKVQNFTAIGFFYVIKYEYGVTQMSSKGMAFNYMIFQVFCCFPTYFLIFLQFCPRDHQYGWQAVYCTVILAI